MNLTKIKNKYYKWRRKTIRERARNRQKIATHKWPHLTMHMTPKERKAYESLGMKWYQTLDLSFGTDITGMGLDKFDLHKLTDLPGEVAPKKPRATVDKKPQINVTFTEEVIDGEAKEVPLFNGERKCPCGGTHM